MLGMCLWRHAVFDHCLPFHMISSQFRMQTDDSAHSIFKTCSHGLTGSRPLFPISGTITGVSQDILSPLQHQVITNSAEKKV